MLSVPAFEEKSINFEFFLLWEQMSSGETSVPTLSTGIYGDLERLHYFVINCPGDILTELMTSPSARPNTAGDGVTRSPVTYSLPHF